MSAFVSFLSSFTQAPSSYVAYKQPHGETLFPAVVDTRADGSITFRRSEGAVQQLNEADLQTIDEKDYSKLRAREILFYRAAALKHKELSRVKAPCCAQRDAYAHAHRVVGLPA